MLLLLLLLLPYSRYCTPFAALLLLLLLPYSRYCIPFAALSCCAVARCAVLPLRCRRTWHTTSVLVKRTVTLYLGVLYLFLSCGHRFQISCLNRTPCAHARARGG